MWDSPKPKMTTSATLDLGKNCPHTFHVLTVFIYSCLWLYMMKMGLHTIFALLIFFFLGGNKLNLIVVFEFFSPLFLLIFILYVVFN